MAIPRAIPRTIPRAIPKESIWQYRTNTLLWGKSQRWMKYPLCLINKYSSQNLKPVEFEFPNRMGLGDQECKKCIPFDVQFMTISYAKFRFYYLMSMLPFKWR